MFTNARAYEQFMGRWSRLIAPNLIEFAKLPDGGCSVLDVGCGTGSLAFTVAKVCNKCDVVGIDASTEYIDYAISRNNLRNVHFKVCDAANLAFPNATFDVCLSLLALNFIPNAQAAVEEMGRVTKRGGQVLAAVWDYGGRMEMLRIFWTAAATLDGAARELDEKKMPLCKEGELAQLWKSAGLYDIHEQALEVVMHFRSFLNFWEPFLLGQGPAGMYVRQLGKVRSCALRKEIKRHIGTEDEKSSFTLIGRAWAVRGNVPDSSIK